MHWFLHFCFWPQSMAHQQELQCEGSRQPGTTNWKQQPITVFFFCAPPCVVLKNHPNRFFQDPGGNTLCKHGSHLDGASLHCFLLSCFSLCHSCDVWITFLGILYYLHKSSCLNHSFWERAQLRGKAFIGGSCISRFHKHCLNYLCLTG